MMLDTLASQASGPELTQPLQAYFIETETPEINVPELLERVPDDAGRRSTGIEARFLEALSCLPLAV
jgi:hypothetical protein